MSSGVATTLPSGGPFFFYSAQDSFETTLCGVMSPKQGIVDNTDSYTRQQVGPSKTCVDCHNLLPDTQQSDCAHVSVH